MKNKFVLALLAMLLTGFGAMAQTATTTAATPNQLKLGFASLDYIVSQMPEYKPVEKQLIEYDKQLKGQLQSMFQEYSQKVEDYKRTVETMLPEVRKKKEAEIQQLQASLQQSEQDVQEMFLKKRDDLMGPLYKKADEQVKAFSKENNYTHVFNSEIGGAPTMLFLADENSDISNLVLKRMGVTVKPAPAAPAAQN